MALNIDAKFEGKLTFAFKNHMRNLGNFQQSSWKSPNWDLDGILLSKVENVWAWNLQGSYLSWQWRMMQSWRGDWLIVSKLTWEILQTSPEHSKISKIYILMGSFWSKYIMFELESYRGVICDCTEDWCKIWRKTDLSFLKWHEECVKFLFTGWKVAISL